MTFRITLVLQALAAISLLVSVVLVVNTQQTDQIGILRALVGRTNTIVKIYLAGVVLLFLAWTCVVNTFDHR